MHDVEHAAGRPGLDQGLRGGAGSGVSSAGLSTTVLPPTSAGAIFQAGMAIGKFHGVISRDDAERLASG